MAKHNIKDQYELPFDVSSFDLIDYRAHLVENPPLYMSYRRNGTDTAHYPRLEHDDVVYSREIARAAVIKLRIAADIIAQNFSWDTTIEGSELWEHVNYSLEAMADHLQEEFNLPNDYAEYRVVERENRDVIFEVEYAEDESHDVIFEVEYSEDENVN